MTTRTLGSIAHQAKMQGPDSLTPEERAEYRRYCREVRARCKARRRAGIAPIHCRSGLGQDSDDDAEIRRRAMKVRLENISALALPVLTHPVAWKP